MYVIDITGPEGNAFSLLAAAERLGKQLEKAGAWSEGNTTIVIKEMQSGDYENLLDLFEKYFSAFITLEGR